MNRKQPYSWIGEIVRSGDEVLVTPLVEDNGARFKLGEARDKAPRSGAIVLVGADGRSIVRVLADGGSARSEVYRLAARYGLNPFYPDDVHQEVQRLVDDPGLDDPALEDLEHLPFVTIDNEDSRDLDQALFIRRDGARFVVYYALADASHYVTSESALFDEALQRGSSYYLPGLTLPMLPRALSEDLISLNQGKRRRSLVFVMALNDEGRCFETSFVRARIRSRCKLSYRRVQRSWDDPWGSGFGDEPYAESLRLLRKVGHVRIAEARRRHVVDHHRVELAIRAHIDGGFEVSTRDRLEVERCNEQISLLCNIEGARLLAEGRGLHHVQPIFRVHPAPTAEAVRFFQGLTVALAGLHGADPSNWVWDPDTRTLDEYLDDLPSRVRPRLAAAIERQAIVMNRRSVFEIEPGEHHGIGASVYARFSSPMREIVGIFTHKEAFELSGGPDSASQTDEDVRLRDRVVAAGNRTKGLQRTLEKEVGQLVLDELFRPELEDDPDLRRIHIGTVIGLKPHLVYVRLDDPQVEVKIHLKDLGRLTESPWHVDSDGVEVSAADHTPIRVGGSIRLRVMGHNNKRRRWLLVPV